MGPAVTGIAKTSSSMNLRHDYTLRAELRWGIRCAMARLSMLSAKRARRSIAGHPEPRLRDADGVLSIGAVSPGHGQLSGPDGSARRRL